MTTQDITGLTLAAMALLSWMLVCLVGHGYSNTVDAIALWLHRHATESRKRHARRTAQVNEQWIRQLEVDGQTAHWQSITAEPTDLPEPEQDPEPEPLTLQIFNRRS